MENNLPVLSIDYSIIFHILNFILLYFLVKKVFFPKIEKIIDARREAISNDLSSAKIEREEALKLKDEMSLKITYAHKEAQKLIDDSAEQAKILKNEILKEANEAKEEIIKNGKKNLEIMEDKLKDDLKEYTLSLAVKITEKILEEKVDKISEEKYINAIENLGEKL
jgi:F-type H+-transporting ATPase subunit b